MTPPAAPRLRLTKRAVDALTAPGFHWDSDIRGFHLRVLPTGRKVYGLQYRDRAGRQHRPKIGIHGQISAEQARDVAREWLVEIAAGRYPGASTGGGATVSDLAGRYMRDHAAKKKPASRTLDEIYWRLHILPVIGNLPVSSITPADVARIQGRLKKKPATANRVRACLHKAFELAEDWKARPRGSNPVKDVKKLAEPKARHRYLTPSQLAAIGRALRQYEAAAMLAPPAPGARMSAVDRAADNRAREAAMMRRRFAGLVMLLLITGARLREWMHGRWEWVDLDRGEYRLPDSKTGAKTILLSPHAIGILKRLAEMRVAGNPFIFPGKVPGKPLAEERAQWLAVLKLAGLDGVRMHDLRHSFASAAKSSGFDRGIVADLLHHSDEAVTEIYADIFNDVVREAQNKTADNLVGWLAGDGQS